MRLALAQLNPLVGDLEGNGARLEAACSEAVRAGAELVVSSELLLWGYPPRDLLLRPALLERQDAVMTALCQRLDPTLAVLVGLVEATADPHLPNLHNAVALITAGCWRVVARKHLLPSYDVFDERRYFRPGQDSSLLELPLGGRIWRLGLTICEDLWVEPDIAGQRLAGIDPIGALAPLQPDLLLNLSASPFGIGKAEQRRQLAAAAALRLGCPVVYVNQVGGNDELVFDGGSFVVDGTGQRQTQLPFTREAVAVWSTEDPAQPPEASNSSATLHHPDSGAAETADPPALEQLFRVLVLGVGDYARKCGFRSALLGLSGGIDSALVATVAAAALGPEQVFTLLLPSPYSSQGSIDDALALGERLGIDCRTVPIAPLMEGFHQTLEPVLAGGAVGVTAENLQSRIRGTLLMAVANQQGHLLLSTGNKSELAVGYCTLYGDMNGGLAVIGDLYKTTVFALCDWLDSPEAGPCRKELGLPAGPVIGEAIRRKPPSAELRPEQRDSDSLPDYPLLDQVLKAYIEDLQSPEELVARGLDRLLVERIQILLRRAEFKRRQAPPLLKVSRRAFGSGWRMPIAAR